MKRRDFLGKSALLGGAVFGSKLAAGAEKGANARERAGYDVVVIGAGTAGHVAAIQAGRLGAKTLLVESGSQPGGTMTTGGVHHPGIFHGWGKQVIAGIGWALVEECVRLNSDKMPDFSVEPKRHWHHQVWINPYLYACLAEEEILKSGADISYYTIPEKIIRKGDGWLLSLVGKNEEMKVSAKIVIDCTGDGSASELAGFKRLKDSETQPGTQIYRFSNYDMDALDKEALGKNFAEAKEKGELKKTDALSSIIHFLQQGGFNQQHVLNAASFTSKEQTRTNAEGRASMMRAFRFLKKQKGLENMKVDYMASETGVRETFRVKGMTEITVQDYVKGRRYPDAVCNVFYPVDLHTAHGVTPENLAKGVVPCIPLSALRPEGSDNFFMAGRCISSDRLANSALRVQAPCMAMGQAVGAAAAICAKKGVNVSQLDISELRETLAKHGAILPELG